MFSTDELNHLPYKEKKIILVTCHRRENYGEPMKHIMLALRQIAERNEDVELVYPVHLSPVCGKVWMLIYAVYLGFILLIRCLLMRCIILCPDAIWL